MFYCLVAVIFTIAHSDMIEIEIHINSRLALFKTMVEEASHEMNTKFPEVFLTDEKDPLLPEGEVRIYRFRGEEPAYSIVIERDFLARMPEIVLKGSAIHEVCHIKLGHLESNNLIVVDEDELSAEKCLYQKLGENNYVNYLREFTARNNSIKDSGFLQLNNEFIKLKLRDIFSKVK